ncbi:MAG: DNA/RNA non-specific endonuclease [Saprospiraceae bacterium]
MTKLRRNHNKTKSNVITILRVIGFIIAIIVMMFYLWNSATSEESKNYTYNRTGHEVLITEDESGEIKKSFLPESTTGEVIRHKYYTLSYDESHEQAEWVAYKLTKRSLQLPNVKRAREFRTDKAVSTQSARHNDYTRSGFTRGHMAPAGDMAFCKEAMQESFFMSNMSPQTKECNGGIWRELEEATRDWGYDNKEVYIVTGPVLSKGHILKKIGRNKVSVPDLFYKIILDNKAPDIKAIAFLIPNERSEKPLSEYAVTIDKVEEITGIDFFADYLDSDLENILESQFDISDWRIDKRRYHQRVKNWNGR